MSRDELSAVTGSHTEPLESKTETDPERRPELLV